MMPAAAHSAKAAAGNPAAAFILYSVEQQCLRPDGKAHKLSRLRRAIQLHHARSFRREFLRSSIFTVSSTAAEMAMLTMTHLSASASLSVRRI